MMKPRRINHKMPTMNPMNRIPLRPPGLTLLINGMISAAYFLSQ
jgi:hypothetical protein